MINLAKTSLFMSYSVCRQLVGTMVNTAKHKLDKLFLNPNFSLFFQVRSKLYKYTWVEILLALVSQFLF